MTLERIRGSFRDSHGSVYHDKTTQRMIRTVNQSGVDDYRYVRATPLIDKLIRENNLVTEQVYDDKNLRDHLNAELLLEHPRLDFISYPYEWSFSALKKAALLHLEIQIESLKYDIILRDASAYNIQFLGSQAIFIDHLSFAPYQQGQFWLAQQQFLEEFLYPLLLTSKKGFSFNDLYRANVHGIKAQLCNQLLTTRNKCHYNTFTHVVFNAYLQRMDANFLMSFLNKESMQLPKSKYLKNLSRLYHWIESLKCKIPKKSTWFKYTTRSSYSDVAALNKQALVMQCISTIKPKVLIDLGCNKGQYAKLALKAGAKIVIGIEACHASLEHAFCMTDKENLSFTPLYMQLGNPSPQQGAMENERMSLSQRGPVDFLLALAVVHHLVVSANIPIFNLIDYLFSLAPCGLIEFVPLDDPQCKLLTLCHPQKFTDYNLQSIITHITQQGYHTKIETIKDSKRILIEYKKL